MGVDKVITDKLESLTRDLGRYVEDCEREQIKKTDQRSCAKFMEKYGTLDLYDEDLKKRYIIEHEDIHYVKKEGVSFILILYETSSDNNYFTISEYLFDRILTTY